MGAQEVIDLLKEHQGKELTALEIAELMQKNRRTVARIISSLLREPEKTRELNFKLLTEQEKKEKYNRNIPKTIKAYYIK